MKVVINKSYSGFGLSVQAFERYKVLGGKGIYPYDIGRDDPSLVQVVEELGEQSWGDYAELKVVEIPDDVEWTIEDYDGMESIHEVHRSWS